MAFSIQLDWCPTNDLEFSVPRWRAESQTLKKQWMSPHKTTHKSLLLLTGALLSELDTHYLEFTQTKIYFLPTPFIMSRSLKTYRYEHNPRLGPSTQTAPYFLTIWAAISHLGGWVQKNYSCPPPFKHCGHIIWISRLRQGKDTYNFLRDVTFRHWVFAYRRFETITLFLKRRQLISCWCGLMSQKNGNPSHTVAKGKNSQICTSIGLKWHCCLLLS